MEAGPSSFTARPPAPPPAPTEQRYSSESGSDSEEEEDTILKRIPVYYTPHYLASLTLLQYPDRAPRPETSHPLLPPALRPKAEPKPERGAGEITARYKPRSQHLEITVPLEKSQPRWNLETAKKMGKGVVSDKVDVKEEGKKGKGRKKAAVVVEEDSDEDDTKPLSRMTYSSHSVPDATNYLVGVIKDNALHLNPVTQTYQLRPYLNYLDNAIALDKASKTRASKEAAREGGEDSDSDDDAKAKLPNKAVQVSIKQSADLSGGGAFGKSGGSGGGNGRAGADLFDPLRNKEGEAWIPLEHYHVETPQAVLAFDSMFTDVDFLEQKLSSITKPTDYLKINPTDK